MIGKSYSSNWLIILELFQHHSLNYITFSLKQKYLLRSKTDVLPFSRSSIIQWIKWRGTEAAKAAAEKLK